MTISLRECIQGNRAGIKWKRKHSKFAIPMLRRREHNDSGSAQRDRYLERLGLGNFTKMDIRAWQRAQRQHRREQFGFRMCYKQR